MTNLAQSHLRCFAGALFTLLAVAPLPSAAQSSARKVLAPADTLIAIVGATVIDGNGGAPLSDATIVVRGKRIAAIGPRTSTSVPRSSLLPTTRATRVWTWLPSPPTGGAAWRG